MAAKPDFSPTRHFVEATEQREEETWPFSTVRHFRAS